MDKYSSISAISWCLIERNIFWNYHCLCMGTTEGSIMFLWLLRGSSYMCLTDTDSYWPTAWSCLLLSPREKNHKRNCWRFCWYGIWSGNSWLRSQFLSMNLALIFFYILNCYDRGLWPAWSFMWQDVTGFKDLSQEEAFIKTFKICRHGSYRPSSYTSFVVSARPSI